MRWILYKTMFVTRSFSLETQWALHFLLFIDYYEYYIQSHAMLPHLGAGAGQGFEDVFVLVQLLTHPRTEKSNLSVRRIFQVHCDSSHAHQCAIERPRAI